MSAADLESLLIVRLGAMGDIIHTLPAVTALRNALPDGRIGWIVEERWAELLCARNSPKSGPVSRARTIVGLERPRELPARILYSRRVTTPKAHVVEQYHSLAEGVVGKSLPVPSIELPHDDQAEADIARKLLGLNKERPFVIITPGTGWGAKQWPPERYGKVASALAQDGLTPFINCGPGEEDIARAVQSASNDKARPILCSITELIALIRRSRLFIGGDTGPLHLAAALQVPVVALFGPTDPLRNGPYGTNSIVLRNPASQTSLSHTSAPDPGLLQITAEEVISAARRLLGSPHA